VSESAPARPLLGSWIRATWIGWLLGIPCVVVLALLGEAVGVGGVQVFVGAGMGLGVGLLQARVARELLGSGGPWVWSSVVGLAAPFLLTDVAGWLGWELPYSLPLAVAVGGLSAGIGQAVLLRGRVRRSSAWVLTSVLGWTLAAAPVHAADVLARLFGGVLGAAVFLACVAVGGLVLGVVTGLALSRLLD